jgi:hypothetical protein
MKHNRDITIVLQRASWLLLFCCTAGCIWCDYGGIPSNLYPLVRAPQPRVRQVFPCDPWYGFHPTCWHIWPGCCRDGQWMPSDELTSEQPADGETIPAPQEETKAGDKAVNRVPPAPKPPAPQPPDNTLKFVAPEQESP